MPSVRRCCDGSVPDSRSRDAETPRSTISLRFGPILDQITAMCRAKPGTRINRCFWTANVTEVRRTCAMDAAERHHDDFVMDALNNRQTVQCAKCGGTM